MGLMDKVKKQAEQALTKAQQGVNQGKAKIDQAQAKHQWDGLLRNLGAAVYAQERQGGPSDAVTSALAALDEHLATHGDAGTTGQADVADGVGDGYAAPVDEAPDVEEADVEATDAEAEETETTTA
jgi:hypothetical protein